MLEESLKEDSKVMTERLATEPNAGNRGVSSPKKGMGGRTNTTLNLNNSTSFSRKNSRPSNKSITPLNEDSTSVHSSNTKGKIKKYVFLVFVKTPKANKGDTKGMTRNMTVNQFKSPGKSLKNDSVNSNKNTNSNTPGNMKRNRI